MILWIIWAITGFMTGLTFGLGRDSWPIWAMFYLATTGILMS